MSDYYHLNQAWTRALSETTGPGSAFGPGPADSEDHARARTAL